MYITLAQFKALEAVFHELGKEAFSRLPDELQEAFYAAVFGGFRPWEENEYTESTVYQLRAEIA